MNSTETDLSNTVPAIIAQQLGGFALAALGAKHLVFGDNWLTFKIQGCRKINEIKITLAPDDTYTVTFLKHGKRAYLPYCDTVKEVSGVYVDSLHQTIEQATGLYCYLVKRG